MTRIKICGITQLPDAACAVEAGTDALGFIFAESPRRISPAAAREIIRELPPCVQTVGVFVGDDPEVERIADECALGAIQLHAGYSEAFVHRLAGRRLILGARVKDGRLPEDIPGLQHACALLLDTFRDDAAGGTGETFDWSAAVQAQRLGKPLVLSGGLNPENVAAAVRRVRPYAVDVSSGVERSPGVKDAEKVRLFIERVRKAD